MKKDLRGRLKCGFLPCLGGYERFLSRGQVGKETPGFWRCKLAFSALGSENRSPWPPASAGCRCQTNRALDAPHLLKDTAPAVCLLLLQHQCLLFAESLPSPHEQAVIFTILQNKTNLSIHFPLQILPCSFLSLSAKILERVGCTLCPVFLLFSSEPTLDFYVHHYPDATPTKASMASVSPRPLSSRNLCPSAVFAHTRSPPR